MICLFREVSRHSLYRSKYIFCNALSLIQMTSMHVFHFPDFSSRFHDFEGHLLVELGLVLYQTHQVQPLRPSKVTVPCTQKKGSTWDHWHFPVKHLKVENIFQATIKQKKQQKTTRIYLVGGWTTHLKNIGQNGNLPQIGVKIKNVWNHHLVINLVLLILLGPDIFLRKTKKLSDLG